MGGEAEKKRTEVTEQPTGELPPPEMIADAKESPRTKRTELSRATAPLTKKEPAKSAADAVKESGLPPGSQEKVKKLAELTVGKSDNKLKALTDMSGASTIMTITKALE